MHGRAVPAAVVLSGVGARSRYDRWLSRAAWLVVGLSFLQILLFGYGRDQGIYGVVADGLLQGEMPYRDRWDFKPPGIYFVFALAQVLFGKAMSSIRIVEIVGLGAMVLAFGAMSRELVGERRVGWVGGALAVLIYAELEFWHTAQPESFGGMLTVFALALAVRSRRRMRETPDRLPMGDFVTIGVLFGLAFLLKPPLGGGAVVVAAYLGTAAFEQTRSVRRLITSVGVMGISSVLPILVTGGWFWLEGAWDALYWTLFEFTAGYTTLGWRSDPLSAFYYGLQEAFVGFSAIVPAGVFAAIAMRPMHGREREGVLLVLGVLSLHLAGIAMQAKFFQYHYAASLPLVAWIAGIGIYKSWRRAVAWGGPGVLAFAAAMLVLGAMRTAVRSNPGTFWSRSAARLRFVATREPSRETLDAELYYVADYDLDADRRVAREVRAMTEPGDAIFVWGFEPVIYFLAGRKPASRYIYDVPQRTTWGRERARRELMEDLGRRPPRVLVVEYGDRMAHVTGDSLDSAEALRRFSALRHFVASDYERFLTVEHFDLYERVDGRHGGRRLRAP